MLRLTLLVLGLITPISGILPEIVDSGISHILEDNSEQGQTELNMFVEVEQLMDDTQQKLKDEDHQRVNESVDFSLHSHNLPPSQHNESGSETVFGNQPVHTSETEDEEKHNNITRETEAQLTTTASQSSDSGNNINHECIVDEDCEKGRYCFYKTHKSKCLLCKAIDVPCTKDEECCGGQMCLWGQCSQNATKGEAGSICQYQSDCSTDLCCAFHKALLFPVCLAKPIERERCYSSANHLMELLSWDMEGQGPREHCPCAGDLQCQPLGRGSLCLKGQDSSEEDLTDTFYSEIDYIV